MYHQLSKSDIWSKRCRRQNIFEISPAALFELLLCFLTICFLSCESGVSEKAIPEEIDSYTVESKLRYIDELSFQIDSLDTELYPDSAVQLFEQMASAYADIDQWDSMYVSAREVYGLWRIRHIDGAKAIRSYQDFLKKE